LIKDNPADLTKPPAPRDAEIEVLQPEQAKGDRLYLFASLALATGARRNELLALRWRDVDLDSGLIRIERALEQTTAHGVRTKEQKPSPGGRPISIPPHIVGELRAHRAATAQHHLHLGMGRISDDATVLADINGRPLSPHAITNAWVRRRLGVTIHSLR